MIEVYIGICIAVVSIIAFVLKFSLEFIGGGINFATGQVNNPSYVGTFYDFIFETSGYATVHLIKNVVVSLFFTSYILLENKHYTIKFLATIGVAAGWEVIEKFGVFLVNLAYLYWPTVFAWVYNATGSGESSFNTVLSDLFFSAVADIGTTVLILLDVFKPISFICKFKKFYVIVLRCIILTVGGFSSAMITMKKYNYACGFYSYYLLLVFCYSLLYIDDSLFFERHILNKKHISGLRRRDLNLNYIFLFFCLTVLWIGAWNLQTSGFLTSLYFYVFCVGLFLLTRLIYN